MRGLTISEFGILYLTEDYGSKVVVIQDKDKPYDENLEKIETL